MDCNKTGLDTRCLLINGEKDFLPFKPRTVLGSGVYFKLRVSVKSLQFCKNAYRIYN